MPDAPSSDELSDLRRRLELLEMDNQRLREKLEPFVGPDNPCFDPAAFMRAMRRPMLLMLLPTMLIGLVVPLFTIRTVQRMVPHGTVLGIPIVDFAGIGTRHPGIGIGIVGIGGAGVGAIGIGGLGFGLIAIGGGSIGVIAFGGGSIGLIAFGGGSLGYIAVGGGACGYYALGQRGYGKHVLALNRQDDPAIEFFTRFFPGLRNAVTRPMPVIPMPAGTSAA